jgi:hypothetical protein
VSSIVLRNQFVRFREYRRIHSCIVRHVALHVAHGIYVTVERIQQKLLSYHNIRQVQNSLLQPGFAVRNHHIALL